jgi:peptidyl-prolyl cis-trans isomerase B (cyclophilin B)
VLTRIAASAAVLVLLPTLAACGGNSSSTTATDSAASGTPCSYVTDPAGPAKPGTTPPASTTTVSGDVSATIKTDVGTLNATLDGTGTPCTVASFESLAKQGYFDNTPCHRLTTQGIYVLQCGDPTGTGGGGPGYTIPDEVTGKEKYGAGTLAMANTGQPNSGGSQFFIVYKDSTANLQKLYTVFGKLDAASLKIIQGVAEKGVKGGGSDGPPEQSVVINRFTTG